MVIFESEDEKNSRAKAILQYLILQEAFNNIVTEEHPFSSVQQKNVENVKRNTYKSSAEQVLKKAKELCFDFLVEDGLTSSFTTEYKNKIIEDPLFALLHNRTPDAYNNETITSITKIIEEKAKVLQGIAKGDKTKLETILTQKSLIDSIIVDDSIDDVQATKTSSNRGQDNKKTRKVVDELYNDSSTASDSINILHAEFSPNQGSSDPDIIKTSKVLYNSLHASLITTTSICYGFINLGFKEVGNIFLQQGEGDPKPSAKPSGTRTANLLEQTPPLSRKI